MSKKGSKELASKKSHGLSRGEKIAIPIIVIIAVWVAYSITQPSPSSTTIQVTYSSSLSKFAGAPDFTLPIVGRNGLTGQTTTLSSFRGKVVLLEFMEPWCGHCQNMAPVLDGLYARYGGGNVVFISVAGSWTGPNGIPASAQDAAKFIQDYGSSWIYVYDSSGTVFGNYGVNSTPTFFIIGKDGFISNTSNISGEQSSDTLSSAISAALSR